MNHPLEVYVACRKSFMMLLVLRIGFYHLISYVCLYGVIVPRKLRYKATRVHFETTYGKTYYQTTCIL